MGRSKVVAVEDTYVLSSATTRTAWAGCGPAAVAGLRGAPVRAVRYTALTAGTAPRTLLK